MREGNMIKDAIKAMESTMTPEQIERSDDIFKAEKAKIEALMPASGPSAKRIAITMDHDTRIKVESMAKRSGITKSDLIAKAVTVYEFLLAEESRGNALRILENGEWVRVKLL